MPTMPKGERETAMIDLYKTFFDATQKVFHLMLDLTGISEDGAAHPAREDAVAIAIGIVGDLQGEVIYRFPFSTALNMVNILSGMQVAAMDAFVTSAVSEIANIISGNVLTALAEKDIKCDLLPPAQRPAGDNKQDDRATDFCVSTDIGAVCLEIRLSPSAV